ncbi:Hypothetical_protein [Hexamita inflata]|uniref:Hypothetical_protein n=1 Tax=Hexamita inflata TaxID=28002 RepID=A0AA86QLU2_9EUKA|nr:Hypothetical protein HINF_LOCUS49566 [Hexamita inflata]
MNRQFVKVNQIQQFQPSQQTQQILQRFERKSIVKNAVLLEKTKQKLVDVSASYFPPTKKVKVVEETVQNNQEFTLPKLNRQTQSNFIKVIKQDNANLPKDNTSSNANLQLSKQNDFKARITFSSQSMRWNDDELIKSEQQIIDEQRRQLKDKLIHERKQIGLQFRNTQTQYQLSLEKMQLEWRYNVKAHNYEDQDEEIKQFMKTKQKELKQYSKQLFNQKYEILQDKASTGEKDLYKQQLSKMRKVFDTFIDKMVVQQAQTYEYRLIFYEDILKMNRLDLTSDKIDFYLLDDIENAEQLKRDELYITEFGFSEQSIEVINSNIDKVGKALEILQQKYTQQKALKNPYSCIIKKLIKIEKIYQHSLQDLRSIKHLKVIMELMDQIRSKLYIKIINVDLISQAIRLHQTALLEIIDKTKDKLQTELNYTQNELYVQYQISIENYFEQQIKDCQNIFQLEELARAYTTEKQPYYKRSAVPSETFEIQSEEDSTDDFIVKKLKLKDFMQFLPVDILQTHTNTTVHSTKAQENSPEPEQIIPIQPLAVQEEIIAVNPYIPNLNPIQEQRNNKQIFKTDSEIKQNEIEQNENIEKKIEINTEPILELNTNEIEAKNNEPEQNEKNEPEIDLDEKQNKKSVPEAVEQPNEQPQIELNILSNEQLE